MTPFAAPTDDILFSLRHVAGADAFDDWDDGLSGDVLEHFASFAEGVLAPLDAVGDATGAQLQEGRVVMPEGFRDAYQQLAEGGWQGLTVPEAFGGMEASPLLAAAVSEVFSGANHAMQMVCNLVPGAVAVLLRSGSAAQQEAWVPRLADGTALSTMCLTEPGAGSDLARIRTKAVREGEGWRIDGEKIFISGGDQDLSQDILHLVLARTGAPEDGVRGLSLFLCDGRAGGITVTRVEEKLGIHASPTCQLAFDGASAELVGQEGAGLKAMFTLMNHARIDVALQGVAHASRAAQIAATYAAERIQGKRADGGPATLTDHADVRRMLDEQRRLALGARAMCHVTLAELERGDRPVLCDLLTPLCKVFASEAGISSADLGIQVLGGYGYLEEYRVAQTWRDARITSVYEGANGIHARALVTRNLRQEGAMDGFVALIGDLAGDDADVASRLERWQGSVRDVLALDDPTPHAHDAMKATADLFYRACWARLARAAEAEGDPHGYVPLAAGLTAPSLFAAVT